jgi:hypothetical protein
MKPICQLIAGQTGKWWFHPEQRFDKLNVDLFQPGLNPSFSDGVTVFFIMQSFAGSGQAASALSVLPLPSLLRRCCGPILDSCGFIRMWWPQHRLMPGRISKERASL